MGLYNMIFGTNPMSELILATLGLRVSDTGRFRDCFVCNGEIAVYTRNGGGNRRCWHADDPHVGKKECRHHVEQRPVERYDSTKVGALVVVSSETKVTTNVEDVFICDNPESADCACAGCIIQHRLPKHPCYLRDEDDGFDSTYATVYFRFPEEFADDLRKLDSGMKFEPDKRWKAAIEALEARHAGAES